MPLRVETEITGLTGAPYLSVMNFGGSNLTDAQGAADAVRAFWFAIRNEFHSGNTVRVRPNVVYFNVTDGETIGNYSVTAPATVTGGASGDALPYATQGLVQWRTGVYIGGREIRGRTFIGGMTENQSANGHLAAASITAFQTAGAALIADTPPAFVIWSKAKATTEIVTSCSAWSSFAFLSSRRS